MGSCPRFVCLIAMGFLTSAWGETETAATDTAQIAQKFIGEKLAVWQQRLKLDDWRISASFVHRADLPPKTMGGIRWDRNKKTAEIWVLDASEYRLPVKAMLDDMELTLVHELVHLDLTSLPRGQASRGSEERAVEGIAQAMLGLERGNR